MRILMISKALLVGAYQRKCEEMAALPDVELTVVVPPSWRDERGELKLERAHLRGYRLVVNPLAFNGNFHLHYYPGLRRWFDEAKPEIVHVDEEPYNLATLQALRLARRFKAKTLFFSWQNLHRRYPFPFNWMERHVLQSVDYALMGNHAAQEVWRAKGYHGPARLIPQVGVDPQIFFPGRPPLDNGRGFVIGYAGRLVPEKGVDVLLRAAARLTGAVRVSVLGSGPEQPVLERLAAELGLRAQVTFEPPVPSTRMPGFYRTLDALVLPSRSRPNWKEQFGRVLIEAMACGVPVIGSDCGEIPQVAGDAGLIFPEEDAEALAERLARLQRDAELRADFAARGRARVLAHYTQARIAGETVEVYREMLGFLPLPAPDLRGGAP